MANRDKKLNAKELDRLVKVAATTADRMSDEYELGRDRDFIESSSTAKIVTTREEIPGIKASRLVHPDSLNWSVESSKDGKTTMFTGEDESGAKVDIHGHPRSIGKSEDALHQKTLGSVTRYRSLSIDTMKKVEPMVQRHMGADFSAPSTTEERRTFATKHVAAVVEDFKRRH